MFGQATRDEMCFLGAPITVGGDTTITNVEVVAGGMVTWAARALIAAGHTPRLVGTTGHDTPEGFLGARAEDRLVRHGSTYHIRVLIGPDGQRSFLTTPHPKPHPLTITEIDACNVDALLIDGYQLLPDRYARQAEKLTQLVRALNGPVPVVVTLPVRQAYTHPTRLNYLRETLARLDAIVCGGCDEHDTVGDCDAWQSVRTTGSEFTRVEVRRGSRLILDQPVTLDPQPVNTNGAGDTFAAILAATLAGGGNWDAAVREAHQAAATHVGASRLHLEAEVAPGRYGKP